MAIEIEYFEEPKRIRRFCVAVKNRVALWWGQLDLDGVELVCMCLLVPSFGLLCFLLLLKIVL